MDNGFSIEQITQLRGMFYDMRSYIDRKFEVANERFDMIETKLDRLFKMEDEDVLALNKSITSHDKRITKLEKISKR